MVKVTAEREAAKVLYEAEQVKEAAAKAATEAAEKKLADAKLIAAEKA